MLYNGISKAFVKFHSIPGESIVIYMPYSYIHGILKAFVKFHSIPRESIVIYMPNSYIHAIENTVTNTISSTYESHMMGKFGVLLANMAFQLYSDKLSFLWHGMNRR